MDGLGTMGKTRYFYIYFDTTEHGAKEPSLNADIPERDTLIGYIEDSGNIYIVKSNGDGTFEAPAFVDDASSSSNCSRGMVIADFNGDGYLDIVATNSAGDVNFYQNKADGSNAFYPRLKIANVGGGVDV